MKWIRRAIALGAASGCLGLAAIPCNELIYSYLGWDHGVWPGFEAFVAASFFLFAAVPSALLIGLPGLFVLDRTKSASRLPGLLVGMLAGIVASTVACGLFGEFGRAMRQPGFPLNLAAILLLPLAAGACLGLLGAIVFHEFDRWMEDYFRHAREEKQRREYLAGLGSAERAALGSRLDREP